MSNITDYANNELEKAGFFNKDGVYAGELGPAIMELITVFANQGHSGGSASIVIPVFSLLADFKPLSLLTGDASEWQDVDGQGLMQNKRCSSVFKRPDGSAYDIDAVVFEDPSGSRYTGSASHALGVVTFPYTPPKQVRVIKVDTDGNPLK